MQLLAPTNLPPGSRWGSSGDAAESPGHDPTTNTPGTPWPYRVSTASTVAGLHDVAAANSLYAVGTSCSSKPSLKKNIFLLLWCFTVTIVSIVFVTIMSCTLALHHYVMFINCTLALHH